MSRILTGIAGAFALMSISGAAEFAMGHDLSPVTNSFPQIRQPLAFSPGSLAADAPAVNRSAKTDRAIAPAGSPALTRTISLKHSGFSDTTILVRLPVAAAKPPVALPVKPAARRPPVACEPVVSVLTEVAKQLQPGRCET
jgi:hypothetical protein